MGYLVFVIGYLKYHNKEGVTPIESQENRDMLLGAIVGGILCLLLLIVLIAMIVVQCRKRRKGKEEIKHLGGSLHGRSHTDTARYIERKPSTLTNVVYAETVLKS